MSGRATGGTVLGIDVGGTKIAAGLVDVATGAVEHRREIPTRPERPGAAVLADAAALVDSEGPVGLSICELVDPDGRIVSAQTVDWREMDLIEAFGPVVVSSDVRAGALAEYRLGAGGGLDSFLYVSVGTGISSTLVLDGRPHAGAHGAALVVASGQSTITCPACGERVAVVPEDEASGAALVRRYSRPGRTVTGADEVLAAAAAGEADAVELVSDAAHLLGVVVARAVDLVDPHAVVMGGGLGLAGGSYRRQFVDSLRGHIWADVSRDVPVVDAALGVDSALIGAAMAAADGSPA